MLLRKSNESHFRQYVISFRGNIENLCVTDVKLRTNL